jgi:FkbM family methyltransferase
MKGVIMNNNLKKFSRKIWPLKLVMNRIDFLYEEINHYTTLNTILQNENFSIAAEKMALQLENDSFRTEVEALQAKNDILNAEGVALSASYHAELEMLHSEIAAQRVEKSSLQLQHSSLLEQNVALYIANRNYLNLIYYLGFFKGDKFDFNGVYLPDIRHDKDYFDTFSDIITDTLQVYLKYNDNYSWQIVDELDKEHGEGAYCYKGPNGEDISVKSGFTVIDAGAWIGDFSAYAAKKVGVTGHVYAFEPMPKSIHYLNKTAEYNGNITVVPLGLGEQAGEFPFLEDRLQNNSGAAAFDSSGKTLLRVETLDRWAEKQKIDKIDFIKADIEGHERYLLKGAREILKKHKPILSFCTYHFPEDPKLLETIIKEINPEYRVIQRKCKLFAFVP